MSTKPEADPVLSDADGDEAGPAQEAQEAQEAQGAQLLEYLSRTASIPGPQRDLIYVQGLGAPFGLASELADRIAEASQNGQVAPIQAEMNEANESAILELLAQQLRTAVGIEQRNTAVVVLRIMGTERISMPVAADSVVTALAPALTRFPDLIDETVLPGLWRLTAASSLPESERLASSVMAGGIVREDVDAAIAILKDTERAIRVDASAVDELVCAYLSGDQADHFVDEISEFPVDDAKRLLAGSANLPTELKHVWVEGERASDRLKAAQPAAAPPALVDPATAAPAAEETANAEAWQEQARMTTAAITAWLQSLVDEDDKSGAQALIAVVLGADRLEGRNLAEPYLGSVGDWIDGAGVDQMLKGATHRAVGSVTKWLTPVNPNVAQQDVLVESLSSVGKKLWEPNESGEAVIAAANAIGRLLQNSPAAVRTKIESHILNRIESYVADAAGASVRLRELERAQILLGGDAIRPAALQERECANLTETLGIEIDPEAVDPLVTQYVEASLGDIVNSWGAEGELPIHNELYEALVGCDWLPNVLAVKLRLLFQSRTNRTEREPSLSSVLDSIDEHPEEAVALATVWLQARQGTDSDGVRLVDKLKTYNLWADATFLRSVEGWRRSLTNEQVKDVWERVLLSRFTLPSSLIDALGFADLKDEDAVAILVKRMADASNNKDRGEVFGLAASRGYANPAARRRFVQELVIPTFAAGVQATLDALDALKVLGRPFPRDLRPAMLAGVRPVIKDNERLTKKATEILSELGFATKGKGPFGLSGRQLKFD